MTDAAFGITTPFRDVKHLMDRYESTCQSLEALSGKPYGFSLGVVDISKSVIVGD